MTEGFPCSGTDGGDSRRAGVTVEVVSAVSEELVAAIGRLIPQLSSRAPGPTAEELTDIATAPGSLLFICRSEAAGGDVIGMLTLVTYRIPTGLRVIIEDVVVDESARGEGAGSALVLAALKAAREAGASEVNLTSRPSREAANRLYERLGFRERDTNAYRYHMP
jgi:ribosomal protein S18 acetylase RimI-like enzyme